ncbi:MAG: DUF58 domain-containing protein, partial [Treponema sp.]|nr:DUF58 domain-containing protein [Treponema sp.]
MKPGRGLFIAALAWLGLGAGAFFSDTLFLAWTISAICLLPVLVLDAVLLVFFCCRFKVERELPLTLAQGEPVKVRLRLQRAGTRADAGRTTGVLFPAAAEIFDLYPSLMDNTADVPARLRTQAPGFPVRLPRKELKAGDLDFVYTLIPRERGPWFFPGVEFLYTSPLCFWRLKVFCACRSAGRTYPDFKKLMAGSALRGLLEEQGIREIRRRGQGLEFRDLREYQEGDPIKSIDWRATGRLRSPAGGWRFIVREYQEEQDQQVLCILDTGYRLRGNEFDAALHGTMLLAYTALKHGD